MPPVDWLSSVAVSVGDGASSTRVDVLLFLLAGCRDLLPIKPWEATSSGRPLARDRGPLLC